MAPVFSILLLAAAGLSLVTLVRSRMPRVKKILLICVRMCIIAVCACAYFQPSFTITRLLSRDDVVPVLVDCSASMQFFNTKPAITFFDSIGTGHATDKNRLPRFVWYGFGDSLRPLNTLSSAGFTDKSSLFPQNLNTRELRQCKKLIIVSDGNWSSALSGKHSIRDKECYYVPLVQTIHAAYLHAEAPSIVHSIVRETPDTVMVRISGYLPRPGPVTLTCLDGVRRAAQATTTVDSGFFSETVALPMSVREPGTRLLHLTVNAADNLESACHILHRISPARFTARLYAPQPSLDKRFMTLAFSRNPQWRVVRDSSGTDVLLLFGWDPHAQQLLEQHRSSSLVFIGALPCDYKQVPVPSHLSPHIAPDAATFFSMADLQSLPPLSAVTRCEQSSPTIGRVFMFYDSSLTGPPAGANTIPLLFEAEYRKKLILVFAALGIWRWDFWSQSMIQHRNTPLFSDLLIARIQELVQYNANRQLYVYPDATPVYETDSLSFRLGLPSHLYILPSITVTFTICTLTGDTVFHETNSYAPFHTNTHPIKTPPLPQGRYGFSCTIAAGKESFGRSDSMTIFPDNAEWRAAGQNTVMLDEIGRPVTFDGAGGQAAFPVGLQVPGRESRETVSTVVQVHRTWLLLTVIFLLFSFEWIVRRVWHYD